MTVEDLAVLCQSGDKSAWEELYKIYKPRVLKIARRFFLCGGESEDLVQEGMCGLYSAVNGYRSGGGSFFPCALSQGLPAARGARCTGSKLPYAGLHKQRMPGFARHPYVKKVRERPALPDPVGAF